MGYTKAHLVERRFRCVSDEGIASIQTLYLDQMWSQQMLAHRFGISIHTVGAITRSIPAEFFRQSAKAKEMADLNAQRQKDRPRWSDKEEAAALKKRIDGLDSLRLVEKATAARKAKHQAERSA